MKSIKFKHAFTKIFALKKSKADIKKRRYEQRAYVIESNWRKYYTMEQIDSNGRDMTKRQSYNRFSWGKDKIKFIFLHPWLW